MKKLILGLALFVATSISAQIVAPRLSPSSKLTQTVGLTDVTIEYSRPSKRDRVVFGDVVPLDEVWRTGANKNTMITFSDNVLIEKDTLKAGTYAIFTKPNQTGWTVYFYESYENWGTPDEWKEELVVLSTQARVIQMPKSTETFTISIDDISIKDAVLSFNWDLTRAEVKFSVPTESKMEANIKKTLGGPTAGDYYSAADYRYNEKKDLAQALTWINKAIELDGTQLFYMLRKKALIQAELKDYKGAIASAKISMAQAEKAGRQNYVDMNKASIEEWSKK